MRIAIAEDLLMLREVITKACETEFGHCVVAEVASGMHAIRLVQQAQPDILILDLSLLDVDGFTVIDQLRARGCRTKILVLSAYSDDFTVFRIERAHVHGFVDKRENAIAVLREALQVLGAGGTYFSPTFESARRARHADPMSFDKVLSESEQRILCLIGEGQTDGEIALRCKISPRTAQTHRHNILWKLGIGSTPKLIAYAMRHGFTPSNPPLISSRTAASSRACTEAHLLPEPRCAASEKM